MESEPRRVFLVDDDPDIRRLLRLALEDEGACAVVAESETAAWAVAVARTRQPDVIVLDHMMPGTSGADAAPAFRLAAPQARIVLFSAVADNFEPGAIPAVDAFVSKGLDIDETVTAILGP